MVYWDHLDKESHYTSVEQVSALRRAVEQLHETIDEREKVVAVVKLGVTGPYRFERSVGRTLDFSGRVFVRLAGGHYGGLAPIRLFAVSRHARSFANDGLPSQFIRA